MNLLLQFKARVASLHHALTVTLMAAALYGCAAGLSYGQAQSPPPQRPVQSPEDSSHKTAPGLEKRGERIRVNMEQVMNVKLGVPDLEVTDQNGKRLWLYQDLVKDNLVVIGTFYTSCNYVCTGVGRSFAGLQKALGRRLGKEVKLILLTRDPKVDSPRRLKEWGKKYGAQPGWTLLTGDEATMRKLIAFFATDLLGPTEGHSDRIFIGNDAADAWLISAGLSPAEHLLKLVDSLPAKDTTSTDAKE